MRPFPVIVLTRCLTLLFPLFCCCTISFAQLHADFSTSVPGGCLPLAVSFVNQTTGASANATYYWDFGNGNSSVQVNPGAIYIAEKNYTITLTVNDGNISSTQSKQVTVYSPPDFDFTTSTKKGCLPLTVDFNANITSGNGSNNYTWDFGDGNVQATTGTGFSHTYIVPQIATVNLTISNSYGCTKTVSQQNLVEILPAINSNFSANKNVLCRVADAVQFANTSAGPGTLSYLWDFGDGTTSTQFNPSHNFNLKGIYTVQLTVNSSQGCSATNVQTGYINVASFNSSFSVPSLICSGNSGTFNNTSSPVPTTSEWYVDGVLDYSYQSSLYHYFPNTGPHTIEQKTTFGTCPDSASQTIVVKPTPSLQGFISNITGNCGAPVLCTFKDTTAAAVSWEWDFNSFYVNTVHSTLQAPSYTYTSDGAYNVALKVTTADGCTATTNNYIGITRPYIYIQTTGIPSVCGPFSLDFSATNSPATEAITSFTWNFGDGSTSTAPQPKHLFSNPGNYSITLTYITTSGCTGTVSGPTVTVYAPVKASFTSTATTICGNTPVSFNAVPQGSNIGYQWDFGDGNPSYQYTYNSVSHQYTYDSTYTVQLIVYNEGNCRDTMTRTNYIKVLPPFPKITGVTNTCDNDRGNVTFAQMSQKAVGYTWEFGDGKTLNLSVDSPTITHHYTATGSYKVVLITTNGQCVTRDSSMAYVLLKQSPLLRGNNVSLCENSSLPFNISNLQSNPWPYSSGDFYGFQKIEYNDLSPYQGSLTSNNSTYYWQTAFNGAFNNFQAGKTALRVILYSSAFSCPDTTNFLPVNIKGSIAGFEVLVNNVCFKKPVVFKDTSRTNSKIVSWQWNFGDGTQQTFNQGGTISHTYASPGNYRVALTITDTSGCSSTSSQYQTVDVFGPQAAFYTSGSNTYITLPISFYNNSNEYNSPQTQYKWDFGDGASSTQFSPVHDYPKPGQYTVKLIASNPLTQCSDTAVQVMFIANFKPAFSTNTSYLTAKNCPPVLASFTNNSISYQSVKWDFGDGNTADNLNYPSHIYEKPGRYIITLYVYGPGGLTGTYYDSITIDQAQATMKVDKNEGCIGHVAHFSSIISNSNDLNWDMGDGSLISTTDSFLTHTYNTAGIYQPALMITDLNGCSSFDTLSGTIKIRPNPVITITPGNARICRGQSTTLVATGGQSYTWSPAGTLSNPRISSPIAKPDSTTTYSLIAKDDIGCTNTAKTILTVGQKQNVHVNADTAVCLGSSIQLNASGTDQYQWVNSTTGLDNTSANNPVAQPTTTTTYTVKGSDAYKCFSDTTRVTVKVLPLPTVSISPVQDMLLGAAIPISAISSQDVTQWLWSPSDYLSCANCPSPISTPLAALTYQLTVTNKDGCKASTNVQLKLQCEEGRVFIPSAFTPNDDGLNDVFCIKGISMVKHLIIYSRWGKPLYERSNFIASDRTNGWDGRYKSELQPAGAYTYFAEMECPTGGTFFRKGTVMLVR